MPGVSWRRRKRADKMRERLRNELVEFGILLGTALTIGIAYLLTPDLEAFPPIVGGIIAWMIYKLCKCKK